MFVDAILNNETGMSKLLLSFPGGRVDEVGQMNPLTNIHALRRTTNLIYTPLCVKHKKN